MHGIKGKRLAETDQYEPLTQQVYTDLIAAIEKLFDALKNDLSLVFGLHWEWQKAVLQHNQALSESHAPVPLCALVMGKQLINELRYDLRENADTVIKINKVIELYRDRMKDLVKQVIFKPKQATPEEMFQQFGQSWQQSPSWRKYWQDFESGEGTFLAQQKLEVERRKLEKDRQEFEAQKRGTGGEKSPPEVEPRIEDQPKPPPATDTSAGGGDPLKTASPDTTDPRQREKVIKLGHVVFATMRANKTQQVDPKQVANMMSRLGASTLDEINISRLDDQTREKCLKAGEAYLAIYGGGVIGELETGLEPVKVEPEQEKSIEELLTFTNKKLVEYLAGVAGQQTVDAALTEFGGKVPRGRKKQEFIQKVLASKKTEAVELTLVQSLRQKLRTGVRPNPKLCLEGVEPAKKITYLKELLRSR